jgi:uncharacterized protein (TIGR02118 family)
MFGPRYPVPLTPQMTGDEDMAKFIVLYTQPKDKDGFEKHYNEVHTPLVKQIPNIKAASVNYVVNTQNTEEDIYLIAELEFENVQVLQAAMSSAEGKRVQEDAINIAPFLQKPPVVLITK